MLLNAIPRLQKPLDVTICPTFRCHVKCIYCFLDKAKKQTFAELPFDTWERVLTELSRWGIKRIAISGGDFFAWEDACRLLAAINEQGLQLRKAISTKIPLDEESLSALRNVSSELQISLDTIDASVGAELLQLDPYQGIRYIEAIMATIRHAADIGLRVIVRATVSRGVLHGLDQLIFSVFDHGAKHVVLAPYVHPSFSPAETPLALTPLDVEILEDTAARYNGHTVSLKMPSRPIGSDQSEDISRHLDEFLHQTRCRGNRETATILPDGKVAHCAMMANTNGPYIGSVVENSFQSIWTSAKAQTMAYIYPSQLTSPVCGSCERHDECCDLSSRCYYRIARRLGAGSLAREDPLCPAVIICQQKCSGL